MKESLSVSLRDGYLRFY